MKHIYLSLSAIAICACAFSVPAKAETQIGDFAVSANVGFVTDYVFRGVSQSDENIAVQGGFDVNHTSGIYAGVWGSNVDFNDGDEANFEGDIYLGYAGEISGFTYDVSGIYYAYPGADDDLDYDYVEAALKVGYDFEVAALEGSVYYSPDFFGGTGDAVYTALGLDVPLPADFNASAHIGHQEIDDAVDYTDWSLGLGYTVAGFDLSLTYTDTDLDEPEEIADGSTERVVFGVSRSF